MLKNDIFLPVIVFYKHISATFALFNKTSNEKIHECMKKSAIFTTIAILIILTAQLFWTWEMYKVHLEKWQITLQQSFEEAIMDEAGIRNASFAYPERPRFYVKSKADMTPEEAASHKGDTLDYKRLKAKNVAGSMAELIGQLQQDALLKRGMLPVLPAIDSLLQERHPEHAGLNRCILLQDGSGNTVNRFGDTTLLASSHSLSTPPIPIGTQDLFYLRLFSEKPSAGIFRQMTYAVLLSAALAVLVMGCLVWQFLVILRKDLLLKQREAAVNGTVHDLKTPLAGVVTLVGWLKKEEKDSQKQAFLQQAEERLKRLRNDIERILTAARGGRRKLVLHKEPTDLPTLLAQAAADTRACLSAKRHTLETDNRLADGQVEADPACLRNVFAQLLENALKYSDEGVRITVKLEEDAEGWVTVSVTDNGWGIPRKCLKKLFGEYYQVPREEGRAQKGYGIGLTYARYVVRAHGGDIRVESREGTGSTFSIRLPRKQTKR